MALDWQTCVQQEMAYTAGWRAALAGDGLNAKRGAHWVMGWTDASKAIAAGRIAQ